MLPGAMWVKAMLVWVSLVSGLPAGSGQPVLELAGKADGYEIGTKSLYAATSTTTGIVYLPIQWDINNPSDVCTLAHELTHYLQFVNQRLGPPAAVEPLAYIVGARCFEGYGKPWLAAWSLEKAKSYTDIK